MYIYFNKQSSIQAFHTTLFRYLEYNPTDHVSVYETTLCICLRTHCAHTQCSQTSFDLTKLGCGHSWHRFRNKPLSLNVAEVWLKVFFYFIFYFYSNLKYFLRLNSIPPAPSTVHWSSSSVRLHVELCSRTRGCLSLWVSCKAYCIRSLVKGFWGLMANLR